MTQPIDLTPEAALDAVEKIAGRNALGNFTVEAAQGKRALKAHLTQSASRIAGLEARLGETRMCVNCGATRPAGEGRDTPSAGCKSPDACTWDYTPEEAWRHWSKQAHELRAENAALKAEVERLMSALVEVESFGTERTSLMADGYWREALRDVQRIARTAMSAPNGWPPHPWHCDHKNSCMRHMRCMYTGCPHDTLTGGNDHG